MHKRLDARQPFEAIVVLCREPLTQQMTACGLALRVFTRMSITALQLLDVAPLCLRGCASPRAPTLGVLNILVNTDPALEG